MNRRVRLGVASSAVICALAATAAPAATLDPSLTQALSWRSIGPFRGGRVLAVEGASENPQRFWFGAVNGGVWETLDAGRTWTPIFDQAGVGSIGALAQAPSDPRVLYVGTGEADMRSDIAQGVGMFRSADEGRTWRSAGLADSQQIARIDVDPRDADTLLVAALGHPYGPNAERGVFRSTDGGRTWARVLHTNDDTGAIDLVRAPGRPDVVYAALWATRRPPWNTYPPSDGPGGGVWKSSDGGRTWISLAGHGLPEHPGRIGLAVTPAAPGRLYALVDDAKAAGLYVSDDGGASFHRVGTDPRITNRGWYFGELTVNPKNADEIYVPDTILLRSTDGGAHFLPLKGDPTGDDFHSVWIDPANPDRRILGVDQGTLITQNGGATWSSWFNQPTGQFYHVVTDDRFPYRVYGAQQDSGAAGVPSRTENAEDGINMTAFHEITAGGESDNIAPDPDDPDIVFGGRVDKLDLKTGQTRDVDPTLAYPGTYRGTWTLPLVFGPRDHALYFANQRIFRTTDKGAHWAPISPDLTRSDPAVPATLDPATVADAPSPNPQRGVVYAVGPSPSTDGLIWAGTDDGKVWKTTDNGAHWSDVTPAQLTAWSKVGVVEPSHFEPAVAYIAVDRHRLDDPRPYVYRTRDGGRSWTPIADGLAVGPALNSVNMVREDPLVRGLLYAGTEKGAFVSFDDGARWRPLQRGLPPTSVRDIQVKDGDLVIATHGRGFYILDDIAPLRALAADPSPGLHLLPPAVTVRYRPSGFTGTPMPKDEPMAPNPPFGAYIDYILPQGFTGPVRITVRDASGAVVRSALSTDRPTPPDLSKIDTAPEWIVLPSPPPAAPGIQRWVWDLRYPEPAALADGDEAAAGPYVPPGLYTVELQAGGRTLTQPLRVVPDPRVKASAADYAAQLALSLRVQAARLQVHDALDRAAALRTRLEAREAAASPADAARLKGELATLDAIADTPRADPATSVPLPPQHLDGLHDLSVRLAALGTAVDGADGAPTPDAVSGFEQADGTLAKTLSRLQALD